MNWKRVSLKVGTVLLASIIFVTFPVLFFICLPLQVLRIIVAKLARCCKPSLGKMVSAMGCIFAADDFHGKPTSNIGLVITLQGTLDFQATRNSFETRVLNSQFPNGDLKYPELKQYIITWLGYSFWKEANDFDLNNHFKFCKNSKVGDFSEIELEKMLEEMLGQAWPMKSPCWEIIIIPNYILNSTESNDPHSVLILRFHHSIGDGFSWANLLTKELCEMQSAGARPNIRKRSKCETTIRGLTFPFRFSFELAAIFLLPLHNAPFRVTSKLKSRSYVINLLHSIPIQELKEIRQHFSVSFSSVIFALVSGAIRETLIRKGIDVPETLPAFVPQPLPNHPIKLRNFMTAVVCNFPTGEDDPIARLKFCHQDFETVRNSTVPWIFKYAILLIGSNMSFLIRIFKKNLIFTMGVSNFSVANQPVKLNGHKWVDYAVVSGLQADCAGLGFITIGYMDGFRIAVVGNDGILKKEDLKEMSSSIQKQLQSLRRYYHSNNV